METEIKFSEAIFVVLSVGGSDHSPILFIPNPKLMKLRSPLAFMMFGLVARNNVLISLKIDGGRKVIQGLII